MEIFWEIPLRLYPDVCQLLWDAHQAEVHGEHLLCEELKEKVRLLPGYPTNFNPDFDTIVVVPKGARITVEAFSGLVGPNEQPLTKSN